MQGRCRVCGHPGTLSPAGWVRKPSWEAGGRAWGLGVGEQPKGQPEAPQTLFLNSGEGLRYLTRTFVSSPYSSLHQGRYWLILQNREVETKLPDSQASACPPRTTSFFCIVIDLAFSPGYKSWVTGPCHPKATDSAVPAVTPGDKSHPEPGLGTGTWNTVGNMIQWRLLKGFLAWRAG